MPPSAVLSFFILFHPARSEEKLRLTCLVWPDDKPNEQLVEVELDNNRTVMFLKKLIKDEHTHSLAHVDARDLVLWKCSIPDDLNLKENLNNLHFDGTDLSVHRLGPLTSESSEHFPTILPRRTIHILVEVPALGDWHLYLLYLPFSD